MMAGALAVGDGTGDTGVYARIGAFLTAQRLAPDPANYAFAHRVIADPKGPLATAVARLVDGGVRLTRSDIEAIGASIGAPDRPRAENPCPPRVEPAITGAAKGQVETLDALVSTLRVETADFGRDLAAGAGRIRAQVGGSVEEILLVIQAMASRVQAADERLAAAKREASDLRQRLEEAHDHARRDPLTNLPNRRAFEEAFAARVASGATISVALVDVDRFKSINDRFGHGVGDRVLKALAAGLAKTCADHFVARFGGEEFAILFADCEPARAITLLDEAREQAAERRLRLRESDAPIGSVTFSAGIVARSGNEALGECLGRADALLYRAKAEGRNRVIG